MKTKLKKVPIYLKLDAGLNEELRVRSRMTGVPQVRILEFALEHYFGGAQQKDMEETANRLARRKAPSFTRIGSQVQSLHRAPLKFVVHAASGGISVSHEKGNTGIVDVGKVHRSQHLSPASSSQRADESAAGCGRGL